MMSRGAAASQAECRTTLTPRVTATTQPSPFGCGCAKHAVTGGRCVITGKPTTSTQTAASNASESGDEICSRTCFNPVHTRNHTKEQPVIRSASRPNVDDILQQVRVAAGRGSAERRLQNETREKILFGFVQNASAESTVYTMVV